MVLCSLVTGGVTVETVRLLGWIELESAQEVTSLSRRGLRDLQRA